MDMEERICWNAIKKDCIRRVIKDLDLEEGSGYFLKEINTNRELLVSIINEGIEALESIKEKELKLKDTFVYSSINWTRNRV